MKTARHFLVVILICVAAVAVWKLLDRPGNSRIGGSWNDALLYWSAGKALRDGVNPYSGTKVNEIALAAEGGAPETPVYYPPWALPLFGLFAGLDYAAFRKFWFISNSLIVAYSIASIESGLKESGLKGRPGTRCSWGSS